MYITVENEYIIISEFLFLVNSVLAKLFGNTIGDVFDNSDESLTGWNDTYSDSGILWCENLKFLTSSFLFFTFFLRDYVL